MNKDIEIHDFDADPGWLGPKKLNYLASISSSDARMKLVKTNVIVVQCLWNYF